MTCFRLIFVVIFVFNTLEIEAEISDKRLCANEDCTEPISIAVTSVQYAAPEEGLLSFAKNKKLTIYSKSAGSNLKLWGAEYNGKRGYVNKDLIKEEKILQKTVTYLVDTELINKNVPSEFNSATVNVEPNKHNPIIVDGTTIYSPEAIDATSVTEQPLPTTAVPQSNVITNNALPNIVEFVTAASNQENKITQSEEKIDQPSSQPQSEEKNLDNKELDSTGNNFINSETAEEPAKVPHETDDKLSENKEDISSTFNSESEITNIYSNVSDQNILENTAHISESTSINSQRNEQAELSDADAKLIDEKVNSEDTGFFSNAFVDGISHFLEVAEKLDELKKSDSETEQHFEADSVDNKHDDKEEAKKTEDSEEEEEYEINDSNSINETVVNINTHVEDSSLKDLGANFDINGIEHNEFNSTINSNQNEINTSDNVTVVAEAEELLKYSDTADKRFEKEESEISDNDNVEVDTIKNFARTDTNDNIVDKATENSEESENNLHVEAENDIVNREVEDKIVPTEEDIQNPKEDGDTQGYPIFGFIFGTTKEEETKEATADENNNNEYKENYDDVLISKQFDGNSCEADPTQKYCFIEEKSFVEESTESTNFLNFGIALEELLILLGISGITVVIFLWGYLFIDKMRKEAPLIAKINNLERELLVSVKENEILTDKINENKSHDEIDFTQNAKIDELKEELERINAVRVALEEQVQTLEKELENSTEVGLELNRMLSEVLSSQNCSDTLMSNIEQLQRQLVEQQSTINTVNAKLNDRDTENHELQLELEINNKKVFDLQAELDKMVVNLLKIEEEKEQNQGKYDTQIVNLNEACNKMRTDYEARYKKINNELSEMNMKLTENERCLELKINEYNILKDNMKDLKNNVDFESLLNTNSVKAEMQQLQRANANLSERLQQDQQRIQNYEKDLSTKSQDVQVFKQKYEEVDKEKVEALTKLEVLNTYFKQRESELQKELTKHESLWMEKQGETTSISEKIKFMQEEIQNFKTQNTSLKQEIVSQEVELKSQISVLEKKAHENWVAARQAERKFEDARQEAAQLRNRLTLRERSLNEEKTQNRLQSPLESNGDHTPHHMNESPASPPLLYGTRDHLTTSPPLPGMHPFLPPPPFMPPPIPGMPPFMPPPPAIYPGDHRPPPLGRMSSPPINSRYSPDSRPYSPYDRNTPSPTDDEYYGNSHRGYNPYNGRDKRDYGRPPPPRNILRNNKGAASSGSGNSNESLEKLNRHNSKV